MLNKLQNSNHQPTLEEVIELDNELIGLCYLCGSEKECCDPDSQEVACDNCGENSVYGPHWWVTCDAIRAY